MPLTAHLPSPFFAWLYGEIKARKVRKQVAIYTSAALTILGGINLFTHVYNLSPVIFDIALAVLLCGLPGAVVAAWMHGPEGRQRIQVGEAAAYTFLLLLALAIVLRIVNAPRKALLAADLKSIAVLPFTNLSDNKEDEYFSDGVTEDIIAQLSRIADLRVISRTSTMPYKNSTKSMREIGDELGATFVLEGSVRRAGTRIRIVGQLIDALNDRHIWTETYDKDVRDVFAIQSDVARNIAQELKATLSPRELAGMEKRHTENIDAYGFYLRGRDYYYRYTKDDNDRAIQLFKKALAADSLYALAYAGLGDCYGQGTKRYGMEWSDSAFAASTHAIALDPTLAEGYKALGLALETKGKLDEALQQYYKAVEINPNYAPVVANIGSLNFSSGRYDEALHWVKKAALLQPDMAFNHALVGLQYFTLGFDSLAGEWLSKSLLLQPEAPFPVILFTYIDLYQGRRDQARERIGALLRLRPDESAVLEAAGDVELLSGRYDQARRYYEHACEYSGIESPPGARLAYALLHLGRSTDAAKYLDRIIDYFDTPDRQYIAGSQIPYVLAQAYALKHNATRSVQWLRNAIDHGYCDYRWMSVDPLLDATRNSETGTETLSLLKERFDAMRAQVIATEAEEQLGRK